MKRTLLFLFFTFSFSSIAQSFSSSECLSKNLSKMEAQKTWENPQWLGLLHMREGWFSPESEVDGKYFFISPEITYQFYVHLPNFPMSLFTFPQRV